MSKTITLAAIAIPVMVILGCVHHFTSLHTEAEAFDQHQWRDRQAIARQNDPGCIRGGMALTLLSDGSLSNRSRTEVLGQLGDADASQEGQLRYNLGQCHWDWRHSVLVIDFSADGLVEHVAIQTL